MGPIIISILILLVCVLLILVVLVQNSKGGGLASNFASSTQVMGVRKTADVLEKATWVFAGLLFFLCIISAAFTTSTEGIAAPTATESKTKNRASDFGPTNPAPNNNLTPGSPAPTGTPNP